MGVLPVPLPVPLIHVNLSDSGTTQCMPAVRVQCSNAIGTDWEILPGKLRGGRTRKARHQHGVLAESLDGAADLPGQVHGLPGAGRSEDAVLRSNRVIAMANSTESFFNVRMVCHRSSPLWVRPGRRERTHLKAGATDSGPATASA